MTTPVIEVRAWDRFVGAVAPDPGLGCYVFAYAPEWLATGRELAPLTMPLSGYAPPGHAFPALSKETFRGLPGLLADALPDAFGNALIDAWMAGRGRPVGSVTTLDRLSYMGRRGLGALEFKPARGSHRESRAALDMKALVEVVRKGVHGSLITDELARAALAQIVRVGTSAGGARAKAVVAWNPTTDELRCGQFEVAPGFEHWLLKFDGVGHDLGRIEYAYHLMACAAGLEMSPCRLLEENGRAHFMTKRFDRTGNARHHVQSLCALLHLDFRQRATHSYAQAFMAVARLRLGDDAIDQLFLRMAFNVMARNCDDHTKNIAFRLRQHGTWELAPAYDVTHAHNPQGEWTSQHLMSVNGAFDGITRQDLLVEADRFGVRRAPRLLGAVADALSSWAQFARAAGLPSAAADAVARDFRPV